MNNWLRQDEHSRAMEVQSLLYSGAATSKEVSSNDFTRLEKHLAVCQPCSEESHLLHEVVKELGCPNGAVSASCYLVRTTQARVRERALQMRRQHERISPLWICCAVASLWALISIPFLWEGFEWFGGHGNVADLVWQSGFVVAWLMPVGLIAALLLWSRGGKAIQH